MHARPSPGRGSVEDLRVGIAARVPATRRRRDGRSVYFVVTEHRSRLTRKRASGYERVRAELEAVAGSRVRAVEYVDAHAFADASAVVLSGSAAPFAAYAPRDLRRLAAAVEGCGAPVLGICGGMQLLATFAGGCVAPMGSASGGAEHGYLPLDVLDDADLLHGLPATATVFQDHRDQVTAVPDGFRVLARTRSCAVQALADRERGWWGTQFHPERFDDERPDGRRVLVNFFALARAGAAAA